MSKLLHSATQNLANLASVNRLAKFTAILLIFGFTSGKAFAQDSFITMVEDAPTTICAGESTTLQVIINASVGPYTITYSDGVGNFTVNSYSSVGDPESPEYGGDPIIISPTVTTTYSLVSVLDSYSISLPVSSATVTITVNPLPTNIVVTTNPASPVCPGVDFTVSATATNGNTFELWNQGNTSKIGDMPYVTSITNNTAFTVRAISTQGCTSTQSLNVNLESTPPVISCPGNQTINPGPATGCSAALPDYRSLVIASDNCTATGSIVLTQSPAIGTLISGHNTFQQITITATDAAGNSNSCNFNVTLIDNINPQITCVENQTVPAGAGCTYVHSGTTWNAVGTDNCTVGSLTYSANNGANPASGTNLNGVVFQPGTTTVTWTVTDGAGNTATCSFNVSISDTQNPSITFCPENQTATTNSGNCSYTHSGTAWNVTATDNCTVGSIVYTLSGATEGTINTTLNGAVFNTGVTTVNVLVSDGASTPNTVSCSFTVTVTDDDAPTVTCPSDITQSTDASACTASVVIPAITFGDNCSSPSLAWSTTGATEISSNGQPGAQTFNIGVTTVTLTVTDGASLTASCSFTVTVNDTELPTITCPANLTASSTSGICSASVTIPSITFTDNCAGSSIAWIANGATDLSGNGQPGAQTFNVGVTNVTITVTDASSNTAQCSFTVTVTDDENPTITCPSDITASNTSNQCSASVNVPAITFGDNCSGSSILWTTSGATILSGSGQIGTRTFNVGATLVTVTVRDAANHTAQCSFTVTVNDTQAPVISGCPANITRTAGAGSCTAVVSWTEPTATDNCTASNNISWIKSHTPGTTFSTGTTTVTYTASDAAGNTSTCTFTVTVNDLVKPVISGCPSNISVGTGPGATTCNKEVTWTEPTATDNCTTQGNLVWTKSHTPPFTFPVGTTTVTYTVKDESNNVSNPCSFNVTVSDNTPPVAACQPVTLTLNASGQATLTTSQVNNGSSDNCTASGSLILTLSKTSFNCSNLGDNTVVFTVKDASGNQSTCNATITVVDNTAPVIAPTATTVTGNVNASSGVCYYVVNGTEYDPTVTDNCSGVTLHYEVTGATTLSGNGSLAGKQLAKGANIITWTASDAAGNTTATPVTFTKTVIDNQAPTIASIGNQNRGTNLGNCSYTIQGTEFDPTSITDNCGSGNLIITYKINSNAAVTASTLAGIVLPTGINTITWTASDGTNTATSTFRVTVADDDAPSITPISDITVNISTGCSAEVSWTEPTASDNCGVTVFGQTIGLPSGSTFPVGTTLIRYTAKDAALNTTLMSFNVIVVDDTPPVLTCPAGSPFVRDITAACYYTVSGTEFNPTVDDGGCTVTLINSFDGTNTLAGKQLPGGINNIVWTVTDAANNTTSCTIVVDVHDHINPTFTQPTGDPADSYAYTRYTDPGKCYFTVPGVEFDLRNIADNCGTLAPTYIITKNGAPAGASVTTQSGVTADVGSGSLASLRFAKDATYPYVVTWTLSDLQNNIVVATPFTISVTDNQPPQFTCYGNEIRVAPNGSCNYVISGTEFDPTNLIDNCDDAADLTISFTIDGTTYPGVTTMAGITLSAGAHTVIWTIVDMAGNSTSCTFTVTIRDTVFPTITQISNQSRNASAGDCFYTAVGSEFDPVANDNCPSPTLINNQNGGSSLADFEFQVGITVVVWTATDASGNATTMQFEVNVLDITAPDFTLPASASRNTSISNCLYTTVGTEFDPQGITDNCTSANYNITNDYNHYRSLAYAQFPTGTTTVTWTVKDFYNNTTTKTIDITVTDNVDPVITCPVNDYVRVVDEGQNYYTVGINEFKPAATDNCGILSYTNSYNAGENLNGVQLAPGTHSITWTAVDAAGNDSICSFDVIVVTELFPPVSCAGDINVNAGSACTYTISGTSNDATSSSPAATLTHNIQISNPGATPYAPSATSLNGAIFPLGNTLVTWTASQTINGTLYSNTCTQYIYVEDNQAPSITAPADITTTTNSGCYANPVNLGTPVTSDNCGGTITVWNNTDGYTNYWGFPIGTTTVTWYAEDQYGNIASDTQTVTVTDDDAPSISCPGSICRQVDDGQNYYTVYDHEFNPYGVWDCSGPVTMTHNIQTSNPGTLPYAPSASTLAGAKIDVNTTSVTWTVTDAASNSTSCTIILDINTDDPPPVTCRGNQYRNTDLNVCSYTVQGAEFDVSSTQSTPAVTLTHNIQTSNSGSLPYAPSSTTLAGAVFPGDVATSIVWTATDGTNTNICCEFVVVIDDNQDPTVTFPDDITTTVGAGSCTATVVVGTPTVSDNCTETASISVSRYPSGNTFPIGVTTVYWTVHDQNGNYVTHNQTITVSDNIAPVIDCPATTYYREFTNDEVNYYAIIGNEFKPSVSDNCEVVSYTNNLTGTGNLNGTHLSIGDHAIIWTALDGNQPTPNTATCTVNVTVVDSFEPILDCPEDVSYNTNSGTCDYTIINTAADPTWQNISIIAGRTLTHNIQTTDENARPYAPSSTTLNGAVFSKGINAVIWTAAQTIGGTEYTSTCSYNVTVDDVEAPVMDTPFLDVTFNIDPGTCISTQIPDAPTATDNCTLSGSIVITNDLAQVMPFNIGTNNVRWTFTDESGNSSVHTQVVTVVDNEGPVINPCPTVPQTAIATGENCNARVSWPPLVATDACSGVLSFTSDHNSGDLFDVGTTVVTYTATDNAGNTSTCIFNVVVTDTPPSITCVANQIRNTNAGTCAYLALGNEFDPTAFTDNCSTPTITWSFTDPETSSLISGTGTLSGIAIPRGSDNGDETGIIPITWTATDASGGTATCTFTLTIEDHEAPVITVPGNQIRSTDLHQNYYTIQGNEFDDVVAIDNCGIVIKLVNELNIESLDGIQLHMGENTITWFAEDDNGNQSQEVFYCYVIDTEPPRVLTEPQNTIVPVTAGCSAVVNYTPPVIIDNVSGELTFTVTPDYAVPGYEFPLGVTEVTYSTADESGNVFEYTFNITVVDEIPPTITCASGSPFNKNTDEGEPDYMAVGTEFDPTAYNDNCSVTLTNSFNNTATLAGAHFPVGNHTVTWTATDGSENTVTCTIEVIVTDAEPPVIANCPDATVAKNSEAGECYYLVPGSEYDPYGFSDNQGLLKLTYSIDGADEVGTDLNTTLVGQQIPVGIHTVVWRLYDLSGNSSIICQTVFTITDPEPPTVVTVGTQTRSTDDGENYYTSNITTDAAWNPVVTDNCEVDVVTYSIDGGDPVGIDEATSIIGVQFAIGTHTIVWSATDIHGNGPTTGSYQVIVTDDDPPTAVCNNIDVDLDATGSYTLTQANINAIGAGSSDPSGPVTLSVTPDSFECGDVGTNTVTLTVTDGSGNTATCDAEVTVHDITPPTAVCVGATVTLDALGQGVLNPASLNGGSSDACGIAGYSANQTLFDCNDVGTNTVTLTVTDNNGNTSTCDATVTVVDNTPPSAVCNPITIALDATGNWSLTQANLDALSAGSADNCATTLTTTVTPNTFNCADIGGNSVIVRVTDPGEQWDECTTTITVVDNLPPVARCQDITVNLDATGNASIVAADVDNGSSDNCDASLTLDIDISNFTCADIGSNTVTLTVTDDYGNTSSCTSTVTVVDAVSPAVTCAVGNQTVSTDNNLCTYTHSGNGWDASATDGCTTIASLTYALSGATEVVSNPANISLDGVTFNKGVTTVTWTAIDGAGNAGNCSFTVTVEDHQNPTAVCQNVTIQLDGSGNASTTAAAVDNGSTDNCGSVSLALNQTAFNCTDLGTNAVTLTVTDGSGNTATCEATVTVQDLIDPVAACKNITVQLDASGNASIVGLDVDNGSSDNCSIISRSVIPNTFNCSNIGANTVTLTVTDAAGNTDDCTATVTVEDNVDPTAICRNITVQLDATGNVSIDASQVDNGSSDACGIQNLAVNPSAFTCANIGPNTVTLTVTDNNGNTSTCDATVTVQDIIAPSFGATCPGNQTHTADAGVCTYTHSDDLWNPTATDNCAVASKTYTVSTPSTLTAPNTTLNGQVFAKGTTTVTWTATDASGNSQTCVFTVTVTDDEDPVALCQTYTAALQRNGQAVVVPANIDNASNDNCGIVLFEISKTGVDGTWAPSVIYDCSEIGTPTAYLQVTDAAGNSTTCYSTITVEDTEGPTLDPIPFPNQTVTTTLNCTYVHSSGWDPTDNCGTVNSKTYVLTGATEGTGSTLDNVVFNTGTTHVSWTATDNHGNTRVTEFDVEVNDIIDPTVTCPGNITQSVTTAGDLSAGVAGISVPDRADNCAVTMLTYELSGATIAAAQGSGINDLVSGTFNVGTTTVTYTAYDAAGNSSTCTFTITINALPTGAVIVSGGPVETYEDQNLGPDTFTVVLPTAPTGNVCIDVESNDITEGKVNTVNNRAGAVETTQICFNETNWNVAQTIYVFGQDEFVDDDDIPYTIVLTIDQDNTDELSGYYNVNPDDVAATNIDNDVAGVTVNPIDTQTSEGGDTGTFTVVLDTEPTQDVTITLSSDDLTEGDVTNPVTQTLTFTPLNWNTPQTVTVTGADELIVDGTVEYHINTSTTSSTDPKYSGLPVDDVTMNNLDNDVAGITVTPTSLTVSENVTSATFSVVLTSKPATDLVDYDVYVDIASNDLTEGTVDKSQLHFTAANWNIPQIVTVTGVDDPVVDGTIAFTIVNTVNTTATTDPNYDPLDPADVTVNNADNDAATLSINSVAQLETNSGTTNFVFTVTHAGAEVVGGYSVSFYTMNGTAKSPTDFGGTGGSINFTTGAIGETQTITITVNGDQMVERDETFSVVLNSVSASGRNITIPASGKTGTGTITNDDNARLAINDVSITEGNSGTKTLNFTVTLNMAVEDGLSLSYATADQTATTANNDYISRNGIVTFAGNGGETQTIGITINGDEVVELDETFLVNLSNIVPVSAPAAFIDFSDDQGVGTILNDDVATLAVSGFTVNESAGTANFTVTLSGDVQTPFTVDFATSNNTALAGSDYTTVASTLTFGGANALVQTISIPILDDIYDEPTEELVGTISNLNAGGQSVTIDIPTATGTITDNDNASLAINDVTVNESDGTATFTVTLTGNTQDQLTVNYATANNTALSTSDYTSKTGTVTFAAGSTNGSTQTITIDITSDAICEPTETFYVNLSGIVTTGNAIISDNRGIGTILDDDQATLAISGFTVTETNGTQTANFVVTMTAEAQENVVLSFGTADVTATAGSDYTAQTGTVVTLTGGSTTVNVPVSVLGDLIAEPTETLTGNIAITNVNGQQITINTGTANSTILDNDVITIDLAGFTVTETESTQVRNFRASMNTTAQYDIVLEFSTADGTALDGSDYTARTAISVTILAGTLFTDIPVDILGDNILEPTEAFTGTITLTEDNGQQATVGALTGTATGTIEDNDAASISIDDVTVNEDAGTATFTVTLTGNIQDAFSVDYATSDNSPTASALAGSDYTTATNTLTFSAGSITGTTRTFTVDITNDTYTEPTETYTVTLSNITGGLVTIDDGTAVGTIIDNDAVTFSIDDVTVAENTPGYATFTVTMAGDNLQDALTMSFTTSDGAVGYTTPANQPSDYTLTSGMLTFAAGTMSGAVQTITVPIINNSIAEPTSEYYTVTLSSISTTGTASFTDDEGLGTITDDDLSNTINLAGFTVTEADGNVLHNFVASLDYVAQEPVIISFTTTQGTALHGSDITQQTTVEYTILPNTMSVNIPVNVIGDLVTEPTEDFTGTIALVNANGQQIVIGATPTATGTINDNDQATLTITGFTVNEVDGTGSFTVTSDKVIQNAITVDFATSNGTALTGSDYSAFSTTLNFGNGASLSQTVPVTILEDLIVEPTETLTGTLSNLQANSQNVILSGGGATTTATSYIEDNDAATLSINNVTNAEPDAGATSEYVFIVTQSGRNTDGPFTVAFTTTNGTAVSTSDYDASTGILTFSGATGETHTITIIVNGDDVVEPTETYTVDLSEGNFGGRNITFTDNSGLGTILDNDFTTVTVVASDPAAAEPSNNGEFTVSMGKVSSTNTVISYTISGDATAGGDYTTLSGTVTIPAGSTSATISVPVIDDDILEDDETVTITLSSITSGNSGISIGAPYIATVIISDDDVATVSITASDAVAGEPNNNGEYTVSMTKAADVATVITYSITGTATPGSDYTTLTGTVTIPAGSTSVTIPVMVIDNLIMESTETVIATLTAITSGDANTSIDTDNDEATVNITDNDAATVSITANDPSASEPSNNGQYTVTMTHASDTDTEISYIVSGTATAGSDYNTLSGTVIIPAGSTSATIDVIVNDDNILESSETVIATLSAITSGNPNITVGTPVAATVTITDNDAASLSIADVSVSEADGTATFTVLLAGNVQGGFTIAYATANNTAVQPGDYTSASGTLNFTGTTGESHTITVPIINNGILEITETYFVNLSAISNALVTYDAQAIGTITDDDAATVSINSVSHNEGNSSTTTYTFTVTLSAASDAAVTVNYATANGSATTADLDYTATSGALTFAAGELTKTFDVLVNGDTKIEDDETFTAVLSGLVTNGRSITLGNSTGAGTIVNDDEANITIGDVTLAEGNSGTTNFSFTVSLSSAVATTVTVDYSTANGTATITDGDYISVAGTLVFSPGQTSKIIVVPINGDNKVESNETFYVNLSNLSSGGFDVNLTDNQALGTINNDDATIITIVASDPNASEPSDNGQFTVFMSNPSDVATVITYSISGSATSGSDFTALTGTVTIPAGSTSATLNVEVINDALLESPETVIATLTGISSGGANTTIGSPDAATVTITDNDAASLSIADVSVDESAGTATFTVLLTGAVQGGFTINYATANNTAIQPGDYTTTSGSLSFTGNTGETQTITVPIASDAIVELTETFAVNLSGISNALVTYDAQAIGTIIDDDAATISIDNVTHDEGNSGTTSYTFTVTMSAASDAAVTVAYASADGTATVADSDYTAVSGTLTFAAGETSKTITVLINGDNRIEPNEAFAVNLSNLVANGRPITLGTASGTGTINNDDAASVIVNDVTLAEGNTGTTNFTFTVTLSNPSAATVFVDYTTNDGTASVLDGDYLATNGTLVFAPGQTTQVVIISVNGDLKVENNETFTLNLSNLSAGGYDITITDSQGVGTITNDDVASITFSDVTANEGNSGTTSFTFTVSMSAASDAAISVDYATANGTATTADVDYTAIAATTLTFAAGETSKTVTVLVNGDTKVEADETFTVSLSNLVNNGRNVSVTDATGLGTITNDDASTISISDVTLAEGNSGTTSYTFTVSLSAESDQTVSVDYATADGTATVADLDYTALTGSLIFAPGETSKTITVLVNGDKKTEANEAFSLVLSNLQTNGNNILTGNLTATGNITNDDSTPVVVDITKTGPEDNDILFAAVDFTSAFTDVDGDALTSIQVSSLPANGVLYLDGVAINAGDIIPLAQLGDISFTPNANWNGSTTFNYTATDGANWAAGAVVTLEITPVNDAPLAEDDNVTTPEDTPVSGSVILNDTDPEGNGLTVTQFVINGTTYLSGITANIPNVGTLLINSNGSFTFTPVLNYNGPVPAATYTITDGNGGYDTADLNITVTAVNDPPVLVDDEYTLCSSGTSAGNILNNGDSDPDGTALTVNTTPVSDATHGIFTIDEDGNFTYDPIDSYNGTDVIVIEVCDNGIPLPAACVNTTITFTVNLAVTANAGPAQNLCAVTSTTLEGNNPSPAAGLWTLVSGPNVPAITSPTAYNSTVTSMVPGVYVFKWTISSGTCTPSESTVTVTNYATPTTATAGADQTICGLTSTSLGGNTPVNGTGAWSIVSGGTGTFSNNVSGSSTFTANAYGTYTLRWTISNGECTASSDDISVTYYETPTTATVGSTQNLCGTLISTALGGNSPTAGAGAWSIVSGGTGSFDDNTDPDAIFTANAYGTYVLRWSISNG
ncbi:MAG: Calx-beta domain-containing protein, partial [Lentimicrobium sp.]|nr:Calx-beta domain-containing protein [Lentimicrobium sp.]